jgi:hypothetical protein
VVREEQFKDEPLMVLRPARIDGGAYMFLIAPLCLVFAGFGFLAPRDSESPLWLSLTVGFVFTVLSPAAFVFGWLKWHRTLTIIRTGVIDRNPLRSRRFALSEITRLDLFRGSKDKRLLILRISTTNASARRTDLILDTNRAEEASELLKALAPDARLQDHRVRPTDPIELRKWNRKRLIARRVLAGYLGLLGLVVSFVGWRFVSWEAALHERDADTRATVTRIFANRVDFKFFVGKRQIKGDSVFADATIKRIRIGDTIPVVYMPNLPKACEAVGRSSNRFGPRGWLNLGAGIVSIAVAAWFGLREHKEKAANSP